MLNHGFDVNCLGYHKCNIFYPLLKAALFFNDDAYYVQRLLACGATVDLPRSAYAFNPKKVKLLGGRDNSKKFFSSTLNSKDPTDIEAYAKVETVSYEPDLVVACKSSYFDFIPLLINDSSFLSRVHALAGVIHLSSFMRRLAHNSTQPGVFLLQNVNEVNQFHAEISPAHLTPPYLAWLVYPNKKFDIKHFAAVKNLFTQVHDYCQTHCAELPGVVEKITEMIRQDKLKQNHILYIACQVLYAEMIKADNDNTNQRQRLMQVLCQYGRLLTQMNQQEIATSAFMQCIAVAQYNPQLAQAPLFQYALERIPVQLPPRLVTQATAELHEDKSTPNQLK